MIRAAFSLWFSYRDKHPDASLVTFVFSGMVHHKRARLSDTPGGEKFGRYTRRYTRRYSVGTLVGTENINPKGERLGLSRQGF